jgi:hypothetical protein
LNTAPIAQDQRVELAIGATRSFRIDVDDAETIEPHLEIALRRSPRRGTLTLDGVHASYVAEPGQIYTDSFEYTVFDGYLESRPATVTLQIQDPEVPPPVALAQHVITREDQPVTILLDGQHGGSSALQFALVRHPLHGELSGAAPRYVYTPHRDYFGADSFLFTVSDGELTSEPAQVTIEVTPVNDAPRITSPAGSPSYSLRPERSFMLRFEAQDVDSEALRWRAERLPPGAQLDDDAQAATLRWTPTVEDVGRYQVRVFVSDGALEDFVDVSLIVAAEPSVESPETPEPSTPEEPRDQLDLEPPRGGSQESGCATSPSSGAPCAPLLVLLVGALGWRKRRSR